MRMASENGRGNDLKLPPRQKHAGEPALRRSDSRLTTFQKLDREMVKFVRAQGSFGSRFEGASFNVQGSQEDSSVRGVRHGVKWKCGWMFEQDSLYWDTVRRQNMSGGEKKDPRRYGARGERLDMVREKAWRDRCEANGVSACASSSALDGALRHRCSTDNDSGCSGMELQLRRSHVTCARISSRREEPSGNCSRGTKSFTDCDKNCREDGQAGHPRTGKGWPGALKAKCDVLQMEKDFADQKLRQQSAEMAQAAEMAHCLRASVQTILETAKKRGTVSAPCTPRRDLSVDIPARLQQRVPPLQFANAQRGLEERANNFHNRIEKLRLKSQVRSADSRFQKELISTTCLSGASLIAPGITSDGEEWAQVQEVLEQLRGKTGSLQQSCENWEKRAFFAESKAASLQIEKWRVETQKSDEKARDFERELVQIRAALEEARNRYAHEQSRLLNSGGNGGVTVVLHPVMRTRGSSSCRCAVSSDCEGCCHISGFETYGTRIRGQEPEVSKEATIESDEAGGKDKPGRADQAMTARRTPNPSRESSDETSGYKHDGLEAARGDSSSTTPKAARQTSELEKSLSQKWFKQRPKIKKHGAPGCENTASETRSNLGNSPIPAKLHGAGRGSRGQNTLRKIGPVHADHMRAPLKEIKRNSFPNHATTTECS